MERRYMDIKTKRYSLMTYPRRKLIPRLFRKVDLSFIPQSFSLLYKTVGGLGSNNAKILANLTFQLPLEGDLDTARLERSIARVRNEEGILRSYLIGKFGKFYVQEKEPQEFNLIEVDLPGEDRDERIDSCERYLDEQARTPLDLFDPDGEQVRFRLIKIDDSLHFLMFMISHIVIDYGGVTSIINRIFRYYNDESAEKLFCKGFDEFIKREYEFLESPKSREEKQYWKDLLKGYKRNTLSKERSKRNTERNKDVSLYLDKKAIEEVSRREKTSTFNMLMLGFHLSLAKLLDVNDVVSSYIISNRADKEFRDTPGLLARLMYCRTVFNRDDTFKDAQATIRKSIGEGYSHRRAAPECGLKSSMFILDENIGEITGAPKFNDEPINVHARINIETWEGMFPSGTFMVMVLPEGDGLSVKLIGDNRKYGDQLIAIRDNLELAIHFMSHYSNRPLREFFRSDLEMDNVDIEQDDLGIMVLSY